MKIDYPRSGRTGVLRFLPSWRQLLVLAALGVLALVAVFAVAYTSIGIPKPKDQALAQTSVVYYRDGHSRIGTFGDVNRTIVPVTQVPQHTRDAVVAAEDRTFYTNKGVSPSGIVRAFVNNMRSGSTQGGSTITQQYVKNVYLTQERTLKRKLKEFVLSIKINRQRSKDEILGDYLNTIYWGRASYGIEAASRAYFGIDASKLDVSQSAMLAGIISSPSLFDPATNLAGATRRWNYVLDGMVKSGTLDASTRRSLTFPKVVTPKVSNRFGGPLGYLLHVVRQELPADGFTAADIEGGGLKIVTTFSKKAELAAIAAVKDNFPKQNSKGVHAGLASVIPGTGAVVAVYGGRDYVAAPGQNTALAPIQGGSTFKAFTLAAALGDNIGLDSRFDGNSPYSIPGIPKPIRNEFGRSYGTVSLRTATAQSINTAFVDLTVKVGPDKVRQAMVQAGLPDNTPGLTAVPSITLGTASVNSLQMADAYATFAAKGVRATPYVVQQVTRSNGAVWKQNPQTTEAFSPEIAADVTDALVGVVRNGTGTAAGALGRPVAGKTGTAQDLTAWFVGYVPQMSTAVEFYNGDGTKSLDQVGGLSTFFGGGYPTQIWTAYMKAALDGSPVRQFPAPAHLGQSVNTQPTSAPSPTATAAPTPTGPATPAPGGAPPPPAPAPSSGNGGGGGGGTPGPGVPPPAGAGAATPKP